MTYSNVVPGLFLDRPNRFIAHVEIDGEVQVCHVKNTGRCRELLIPGTRVYLQVADNPARKTKYDLIAVEKGDLLINMDSQAPNRVAADYLPRLFPDLTLLRPETVHGDSRFDFYLETPAAPWFVEVKGVTLEENGTALFPDAPTQRGVKHLDGLRQYVKEGYRAMALFVVQMKGPTRFLPNHRTDPAFAAALSRADQAGVLLHAVDCLVTPDSLTADAPIPVILT